MIMKAFFLDRDGVLNKDSGYTYKIDDLDIIDGVYNFITEIKKRNYLVIVLSNQSGVARGYFRPSDVKKFNQALNKKILDNTKFCIDRFYFCPYHTEGTINRFKKKSDFRKPGNKMLEKAMLDFKINNHESFLIGDKDSDMVCAKKSNVRSFLFNEENLFNFYTKNIKKLIK